MRGSKAARLPIAPRTIASASVSGGASSSARGVGSMPERVLTNSGSPNCLRRRPSALLIADWVRPICAAARVTLPWRNIASNTSSRFRSGVSLKSFYPLNG